MDNMKLYVTVLVFIGASIVVGLLGDLGLYLWQKPTVTAFLRANPEYFWAPVVVIQGALLALAIHLFVILEIMSLWNKP